MDERLLGLVNISVLMADDHPVVRAGMRAMISSEADLTLVAEAYDGEQAVSLYDAHQPDVVIMDLRMPRMDGIAAIRRIVAAHPEARVLALTSYDGDADIFRALEAGAKGYLIKDMLGAELVRAIRAAAVGERVIPSEVAGRLAEFTPRADLSARETEVLRLTAKGLRNRDIARLIDRTEETVKAHLKNIMAKLSATDRTEAVMIGLKRGIIHLDD
jgi:DNA-binding NarL/FixJ family response regulator